jgi:hypothetical protein
MAYIMTTEAEIIQKAGAGKGASFDTTMMTASNLRAESMVNCLCRYNFSDKYATLNADVKGILSDICSSFAAIEAICYDMSNYSTRTAAENQINVLRDGMMRNLSILRDKKTQDFINGA